MAYSTALCRSCPVYFAASFVSSTARPLYSPHFGQARWGSFFSWQFGHSETPVWVRKSWARRLALRREEWRLFGFGMVLFLSRSQPSGPHSVQAASRQGGTPENQCFVDFTLLRNPESASQRGSV